MRTTSAFILTLLMLCAHVLAASPELRRVVPRAAQRGTEVEVTFAGERLGDAQEVLLYQPGLTVTDVKPAEDGKGVTAKVTVAPDAALGQHMLRLRTATGVSELQTFHVTALPIVGEIDAEPQPIDLNVTVAGVNKQEDADGYVINATKDQPISIEVTGIRLGGPFYDPAVTVTGPDGAIVAESDDTGLLRQDPFVSFLAPSDGQYTIEIHDAQHGGSDDTHYLMHVGTFPRPAAVFPAGGQEGKEVPVRFIGDARGEVEQTITLPDAAQDTMPVFAEQDGQTAPSPNAFRVSAFPDTLEAEPNNNPGQATLAGHEPPVGFNGVLAEPGDMDCFRFVAKKDQEYDIQVYARRLRTPVDPVLNVFEGGGKHLHYNDDNNGEPDARQRFKAPADGEFVVRVHDHQDRGGPEFVYRVEVTPVAPHVSLTIPFHRPNSQERHAMVVPRGNRFATVVRANRNDFGGEMTIGSADLPPGVTMHAGPLPEGADHFAVVFEAAADAPVGGTLADLSAKPIDPNVNVPGFYLQPVVLVSFGNNQSYFEAHPTKLAIAVAEEAPFKLSMVEPKVPLVQNGVMQLKIVAERKEGFDKPIRIHMPYKPPGVGAGDVTIEPGQTEATMPVNAAGNARVQAWTTAVLGHADTDAGRVWASSQLFNLTVAEPYVGGKIEMAAAQQGQAAQVACVLEQRQPFNGKARAELVGLPPNTSAEPVEITSSDERATFSVTAAENSPSGQHKSLFVRLTIERDGEPIVHQFAHGGTLRIDPPQPDAPAAQPAAATEKPMSRLEQLRAGK